MSAAGVRRSAMRRGARQRRPRGSAADGSGAQNERAMTANPKTEGGHKRGHSNMEHYEPAAEVKDDARLRRRLYDVTEADRGVLDALWDYDRMICSVPWCRVESATADAYERHRQTHIDDPDLAP